MMQTLSVLTPKDRTTALVNLVIKKMATYVKVSFFFGVFKFRGNNGVSAKVSNTDNLKGVARLLQNSRYLSSGY